MLCVVVPEVEDGDFNHLKGSALNVHSSVIKERQGRNPCFERVPAPERFFPKKTHRSDFKLHSIKVERFSILLVPSNRKSIQTTRSKSHSIRATGIRSKIYTCQPPSRRWLDDCLTIVQSERGNRRDGSWLARGLARINFATHSSRSNTVGFWFSSRTSSGPFGWIFDWKVREESKIFQPLCCEVWNRSDAFFWGKIAPVLDRFSSLVSLLLRSSERSTPNPSNS